ncbi:uncharacterized protein LOC132540451 isoform X1 [Erinaceus europaeus]|uniref:Uncharacterized protein LOC132536399 isoform X3 n=1 Tax=Erinaceus europaeus TaxID=9365 RepID=A0ABM3XZA1_ERIEU|nr:uncharacterized protein LOC132536399 isoform X3 [Erinaceus europaeus]XP_060054149.1 uncharacterized protein LOC132540435 isoform X3 [Erinaceus europaeus]XP_060054154.1 uncharacterized protein LOC132540436 isoform X3 [Erinaceus europaeus]XP_060054164.1 uncharacterized protein LOC132540450 isoform X3 [Erinaceus europaeus]XP_060054166.1 uncharacterized protein LOC132540451 isoform X1 [Erinaceus europaeus]XP_060054167.1 uncharacterized protein LOC132540451 isoform X1 [Erinaceus europaeus]
MGNICCSKGACRVLPQQSSPVLDFPVEHVSEGEQAASTPVLVFGSNDLYTPNLEESSPVFTYPQKWAIPVRDCLKPLSEKNSLINDCILESLEDLPTSEEFPEGSDTGVFSGGSEGDVSSSDTEVAHTSTSKKPLKKRFIKVNLRNQARDGRLKGTEVVRISKLSKDVTFLDSDEDSSGCSSDSLSHVSLPGMEAPITSTTFTEELRRLNPSFETGKGEPQLTTMAPFFSTRNDVQFRRLNPSLESGVGGPQQIDMAPFISTRNGKYSGLTLLLTTKLVLIHAVHPWCLHSGEPAWLQVSMGN